MPTRSVPKKSLRLSEELAQRFATARDKTQRAERTASLEFGGRPLDVFELQNGLRLILVTNHTAPVVSYHTWFGVGSRNEKHGKTGLAHLFEHLMFNETENLPAGRFDQLLERAGAQTNAATWNDWTYYHADVPSDQLSLVVRLEAERMQNLVLRREQLESEREVVANERRFRVDDDVDGTINELLYKTAFRVHPYHHPTIGWMEDILNFTTDDLRSFYKTWYAPNNATIVVVGDVDPAAVLRLVVKHYGLIRRAKLPAVTLPEEPVQTEERVVEIQRPTPSARVAIGYKSPRMDSRDHVVMTVLSEILFGGRASRVFRELVTRLEIATDIAGSVSAFADPGLFEIYLTGRQDVSTTTLEAALDRVLDEVVREGVTARECERAVARLELGALQGLENVGGAAEQIGFYQTVMNNPCGALSRMNAMRTVTPDEVNGAARLYLRRTSRTIVRVHPSAEAEAAS